MGSWNFPPSLLACLHHLWLSLLRVESFPSLVNHVGMNCICVARSHLQVGKRELGRIGEARHSLIPMGAGQNDGVPLMMYLGRRVAQIGDRSIQHPGSASVRIRGVAAVAHELAVKEFALMNCFQARSLLRR